MFAATNFNSCTMMMKPVPVILMLTMALLVVLVAGAVFPAYADTPLYIGCPEYHYNDGRPYWEIRASGDYYLAIAESSFSTNNHFTIRIYASNVVLDGKSKTLTASGPIVEDKDNISGVRVNGGWQTQNVTIKNLNVEKKFYGIVFEWHKNGRVENCNTSGNVLGITICGVENTTITGNTANSNNNGIVLDAWHPDDIYKNKNYYNSLTNNTTNNNLEAGIILHHENAYNSISGNKASGNQHGISLWNGCHHNTLSENATRENPVGIVIVSSYNNLVKGNTIVQNQDGGLWLYDAKSNNIYDNYFSNAVKNVAFKGTCIGNQWNIAKTAGPNIVGGPYLGGNFWATPVGDGFSQTTPDSNGDGFCDRSYAIRTGDVDNLPLHEVKAVPPTVTTSSVSAITCNAVSSGGNVTSSGGASVTARGVCWSTSENPTISDSHTSDGTGTGAFQSTITGLNLGAAYHVRAYATNSAGTGYGADLPFATQPFEGIVYVSPNDQTCGANCPCYPTIQDAIDSPYNAHTIKIAGGTYPQAITLDEPRAILVEGGWNDSFTLQSANTAIKSPTVQTGAMTFRNLTIVP